MHKPVRHLRGHRGTAIVPLLTLADQLGDTSQTHLCIDHEVIRCLVGSNGVEDVH